jgi:RHH-type proline utilization regulon transcriptional repressor/proline dehydrogenase/delta 1-pyrroline-5-carboxylate dehydrogenase
MLKPCVKWGVRPGSYTFTNELFAPLLSVVCADNFEHAIALANSSEYGLTAGLQSLDESEQKRWKNSIEAGNLYINRGITGAIVSRQPFGGMKRSAFGGGIKAGGPNYVSCFVNITNNHVDNGSSPIGEFKTYAATFRNEDKKKLRKLHSELSEKFRRRIFGGTRHLSFNGRTEYFPLFAFEKYLIPHSATGRTL